MGKRSGQCAVGSGQKNSPPAPLLRREGSESTTHPRPFPFNKGMGEEKWAVGRMKSWAFLEIGQLAQLKARRTVPNCSNRSLQRLPLDWFKVKSLPFYKVKDLG